MGNLSCFRSCRARAITFQLKRNASIPDTRTFKVQFVTTEGKVICERYINLDTNMINDDPELAAFSFETEKEILRINIIEACTRNHDKYSNSRVEFLADYEII